MRGNSKAGFSHWGCRGPESGRVLPEVTQQGWNRELLTLGLLLSPDAASHLRLTSYFIVTSRALFLYYLTELPQLPQEMGTPALQVRKLRLRGVKPLAQSITGGWRNCWDKAGFLILPWLSSKGVASGTWAC